MHESNTKKIVTVDSDNLSKIGFCGYKNPRREGFLEKYNWLLKRFQEGLQLKAILTEQDGSQGMIEYIPGRFCWRPVKADEYMFIHCLFVGFKKVYKQKGYGKLLLDECFKDAKQQGMKGISVVTRKGPFMVGKEFFLKHGFEVTDRANPDFELLVQRFDQNTKLPHFKPMDPEKYKDGLYIIRADQCPYTVKNVREIRQAARQVFGLKSHVIDLQDHQQAQKSPCPFGTFCIIYQGRVISCHPISKTRFLNIMHQLITD